MYGAVTRFHKTLLSSALLTLALPANALASATVTRDGSGVVTITSTTDENNDIIAFNDGAGTLKVQELGAAVSALSR